MNWLKKLSGVTTKGELFSQLSLEEKRMLLHQPVIYLQTIFKARKEQPQTSVLHVGTSGLRMENVDFVNRMSDNDMKEAIELARLSVKATIAADAKDHREAIRCYEQIIARAPFDSMSMMGIGVHYAYIGDGRKAVSYLEKALQMDPNNQRIRDNLERVRQSIKE